MNGHSYFCKCVLCEAKRKAQSDMEPYRLVHARKPDPFECEVTGCSTRTQTAFCAACCVKLCADHQSAHPCGQWCADFPVLKDGTGTANAAESVAKNLESMRRRRMS